MENFTTNNSKQYISPKKKSLKFAKNRFTDMTNKIQKKHKISSENEDKNKDENEEENKKKLFLDKIKISADKETSNETLLLKILDNQSVYDYIDNFFYRQGTFDIDKEKHEEFYNNDNDEEKLNASESSSEFFKKFKSFHNDIRKGIIKTLNPSIGFIEGTSDTMIVPNPIGLISKNGENNIINLK